MEGSGLCGVIQVGAAAKLNAVAAHVHHADDVAVFLAEKGGGAAALCLGDGHLPDVHIVAGEDSFVDHVLHLSQLLGGDGGEVGEVKTQEVRLHQGSCLVHMLAQDIPQGPLEQVGGAVGAGNGGPADRADGNRGLIAQLQAAGFQHAVVHNLAALVLLDVIHVKAPVGAFDAAVVRHLAAHLGVHGGLVKDDDGLRPGGDLLPKLAVGNDGKNLCLSDGAVITHEPGVRDILSKFNAGPAQIAQGLSGLAGADPLLLHELFELVLVNTHPLILAHLDGQVDGETVGIIELEGVSAGEGALPFCLVLCQQLSEDLHAGVDGSGKVFFLGLDHLGDIVLLLPKLRVLALVFMDDGVNDLIEEGLVHAQKLAVAGSPAEQAAEHIAPALVGRQNAVADHEGGAADMVGDDTQGDVHFVALAVIGAGKLADLVGDVHHRVHIKQGVHALADHGQTLKTHAGVNILLGQVGIVALAVVVKLGENIVPDLDIAVAVAAHGAAGLAAAVLLSPVKVDLRAGAAGSCAVLPEVVLLAEAENALGGDADLLVPDVEGLVVIHIDRGVKPVRVDAHPLGRGEEFPAPSNGLVLEIVAEGEVAQHLKIGAVAGGLADIFNVAGADALLAGADPVTGRLLFALEVGLHGGHAGVDEQKAGVVLGNQREAGQAQMALALKKAQKHLSQLVKSEFFHVLSSKKIDLRPCTGAKV